MLQVEVRVYAKSLQQGTDIVVCGLRKSVLFNVFRYGNIFCRRALRLRDAQVAQRFYSPQQIADQYETGYLKNILVGSATASKHKVAEQEKNAGQYDEGQPHFLVL